MADLLAETVEPPVGLLLPGSAMKVVVALLLACLGVTGCANGKACTSVGGSNSFGVYIPAGMFFASQMAAVEICDEAGCGSTSLSLPRQDRHADAHGFNVGWPVLGRRFGPGPVTVTITLTDARGTVVAVAHRDTTTRLTYPNGKVCDGDRYLDGQVNMKPGDRVS